MIWHEKVVFILLWPKCGTFEIGYFCAQKSIIKAGNNKFQDLINAPRNNEQEYVVKFTSCI